jgi:hypothetical protein
VGPAGITGPFTPTTAPAGSGFIGSNDIDGGLCGIATGDISTASTNENSNGRIWTTH